MDTASLSLIINQVDRWIFERYRQFLRWGKCLWIIVSAAVLMAVTLRWWRCVCSRSLGEWTPALPERTSLSNHFLAWNLSVRLHLVRMGKTCLKLVNQPDVAIKLWAAASSKSFGWGPHIHSEFLFILNEGGELNGLRGTCWLRPNSPQSPTISSAVDEYKCVHQHTSNTKSYSSS